MMETRLDTNKKLNRILERVENDLLLDNEINHSDELLDFLKGTCN